MMCTCVQVPKESRGMGFPLELELLAVVCCLMWVLGLRHGSSGRAVHALNHRVISPALSFLVLFCFETGFFLCSHTALSMLPRLAVNSP